ncbi:MAG: DUF4349 domain-containing protein [Clostridiales Family XIII bacterium]|jgi:hypothetical protein|nr:DUF4349 domain-containing protein [Clostridiales Family XIII bacterium]
MKRRKKIFTAVIAMMLVSLLFTIFTSCGASTPNGGASSSENKSIEDTDTGSYENDMTDSTAPEDVSADSAPSVAGTAVGDTESSNNSQSENALNSNRKITFRATFIISTKNFDEDYSAITKLLKESKGYIASEDSYTPPATDRYNNARSSSLSLKIPVGKYDSFMHDLEEIGEVSNKSLSSEDITSQYFDTEAHIELLEMRKTRLLEYIEKATSAKEIVQFDNELSTVLYELDQYQGEKRKLDQLVDFATIDVNLEEQITPDTIGADGKPLGDRAGNAFLMSVHNVKVFLGNFFVGFVGAIPILILLAVIGGIVWIIIRLVRHSHRNRKTAQKKNVEISASVNTSDEHKETQN